MENLNLTVVIPFYNGYETIDRLLQSLPRMLPIIIVDDQSDKPFKQEWIDEIWDPEENNIKLLHSSRKGYFSGAVNQGIRECTTDVLVLNQDVWFNDLSFIDLIETYRNKYAFFGERIRGDHPSFGALGYIHGTFMLMRRDAIEKVGLLNEKLYPLWGSTAEYQWRVARAGFGVLPLPKIPGMTHARPDTERYGSGIRSLLDHEKEKKDLLIRTPPLLSVIVPCYNYGHYIQDCINSLIGGPTSLGKMEGQTLQSFEVLIVDDASTDNSWEMIENVTSLEKGIRSFRLPKNVGTAQTLNYGIKRAVGKYITFLSADDMRESDSLEKLVEVCEQNPHSFAYDDVWLVAAHQRVKKWEIEEYDFETLIWRNQIPAGIVYPRKAWEEVGGYPAIMGDGREDWAFNVALGISGWCGVHLHNFGYLYRREGQNRTEHNTTEHHRQQFLEKIMGLFPDIYGGYRPVACCGKGGNTRTVKSNSRTALQSLRGATQMADTFGQVGMARVRYTGKQMLSTWQGEVTGVNYSFGVERPKGWVDKRDLGSRDEKKGFLGKKDRATDQWLFESVAEEKSTTQNGSSEPVVPQQEVKEEEEVVAAAGVSETAGTLGNRAAQTVGRKKISVPNPEDLTVAEIKDLDLTLEQWEELYRKEMAGPNRKGAVSFLEETIANLRK